MLCPMPEQDGPLTTTERYPYPVLYNHRLYMPRKPHLPSFRRLTALRLATRYDGGRYGSYMC